MCTYMKSRRDIVQDWHVFELGESRVSVKEPCHNTDVAYTVTGHSGLASTLKLNSSLSPLIIFLHRL